MRRIVSESSFHFLLVCTLIVSLGCSTNSGSLKMEAQIIYGMGGPQPVAQETFYLLDTSFDDLMRKTLEDPSMQQAMKEYPTNATAVPLIRLMAMLAAVNKSRATGDELNAKPMMSGFSESMPLWKSHIIKSAETDFKGQTLFENIPSGDYWITGTTQTRGGFALWNYKVSVARGENHVMLSQNNAMYSK